MPKFSVITPCHREDHLSDAIDSVLKQTFTDWELILVPNGGLKLPPIPMDARIKIVDGQHLPAAIGAIKNFAFSHGIGDYLVELDSDDLLLPNTLSRVSEAISSHPADFYYSNDVLFEPGFKRPLPFRSDFGRRQRPIIYNGHLLDEEVAFKMNPSTLFHINHAPDHVRVWRREFYHQVGGHDSALILLDDLDLMCKTYLYGTWYHINMPLYMYRLGNNSWEKLHEERLRLDYVMYERYMDKLMRKWAKDNCLLICENIQDFYRAGINTIGYLRLWEELHKVEDKSKIIDLIYQKMAPGGYFTSRTIHGLSDGYVGDPTSRSQWNLRTFEYWSDAGRAQTVGSKVRWRSMRGYEWIANNDPSLKFVDWTGYALKGGEEEIEGSGWRGI